MIPKNKNIAILHPYVNKRGGAVNMMIFLGNLLQEKGNHVTFYTFSYDEKLFKNDIKFKIKTFSFLKISYFIRNSDYVFVGNSPMQFVGVLSKIIFLSKTKIIWRHHHYPWYYGKNTNIFIFLKRYVEKLSLRKIDVLVANSIFIRNSLKELYNLESKLLYPVLDKSFLNYKNKNKNFETNTIITYGRWVKGKNIKQIFQTYDYLKEKNVNFKLLIGGVGESLDFYKKKYFYNNNIKFLGLLNKKSIIDNLDNSNIFIFPSKIDSFGLSALEAMSIGVPVVGFSGKGLSEFIQNGKNGFLVESSKDFTDKILLVLQDKDLNKLLSNNSLKVGKRFSHTNFLKQLETVFLEKYI